VLEREGRWSEARAHYIAARDRDGLPLRCTTPFQNAARAVAARHPRAILVDGPGVLRTICPHGIVDAHAMQDGHHASLRGIVALARAVLGALRTRGEFGWRAGPVPALDPAQVAAESGMDRDRWLTVCDWGRAFYRRVAEYRFDGSEHIANAVRFEQSRRRIAAGEAPRAVPFDRLSVRPLAAPGGDAACPAPACGCRGAGSTHRPGCEARKPETR
jgi:hypothetical protein